MTQAELAKPSVVVPASLVRRVPRPADSANRAYAAIRQLVVDFNLQPDERINEFRLARSLSLSRTPVREALNRLSSEGFLVFSPNRGFIFRAPEPRDVVQFYELRAILECGAFAQACRRATDRQIEAWATQWVPADNAPPMPTVDERLELDEEFHLGLVSLSGNQELVRQLSALNARLRFVRRIRLDNPQCDPAQSHEPIARALIARDEAGGQALLARHIILSTLDGQQALDFARRRAMAPVLRELEPA